MKLFSRLRGRCFCAFCKAKRKIYVKKHIDLTNVLSALLLATAVGQVYWGQPDPRALVIFCVTLLFSEIFVYLRWRSSLVCTLCGFDPILYKRSPQLAAARVRAFYKEREHDPGFWLTRSPLLEQQREKRSRERKIAEYRSLEAKHKAKKRGAQPPVAQPTVSSVAPPRGP